MVTKIPNVRKFKNQNLRFQKKASNLDLNLFSFFSLAKSIGKTLFHNPMVNGIICCCIRIMPPLRPHNCRVFQFQIEAGGGPEPRNLLIPA